MTEPEQHPKLTAKQKLFVSHYLGEARYNATKAAVMAGYSERSASDIGYENLRKPEILARVREVLASAGMPAEAVIAELTDVASAEWRDFVTVLEWGDDGKPLKVKMDLGSKVKALEILAKHHGLLTENLLIGGGIELREIVGVPADAP